MKISLNQMFDIYILKDWDLDIQYEHMQLDIHFEPNIEKYLTIYIYVSKC